MEGTQLAPRPNILWFCTEHQRFDTIAALGNPYIKTPNIDRLVREGVAFTHAFCQNPVCTPSRTSFLTGRYPVTTGCRQNGQNMPEHERLVTQQLRDIGYDCGLVGKLHVSAAQSGTERRVDDGYGYYQWSHGCTAVHGGDWVSRLKDEYDAEFDDVYLKTPVVKARRLKDRKYHQTTWSIDKSLEFLAREQDEPWLLSVNPWAAHDPFEYLDEYFERFDIDSLPLPVFDPAEYDAKPTYQKERYARDAARADERQLREMVAAYYATLEHLDTEFGRLLDRLDETGQRENTLIIFMSDHGELLGDHGIYAKGPFLYEPSVRVPLIFSWPDVFPSGMRSDALVELVDVVPTLYEVVGEEIPERVQGKSLLPVIRGEIAPGSHRRGAYSEHYNSTGRPGQERRLYATMWREKRFKVVVYHDVEEGELYDLAEDPNELRNLWDLPEYRDVRLELVQRCFGAAVFAASDPTPARISNF